MSLNYQYYGKSDTKEWSEADWGTYNALVWFTLAVDIGFFCEKSADEFCRRVNAQQLSCDKKTGASVDIKKEDLEKFYGLGTNVITISAGEWAKKRFGNRNQCNAAWVKEVNKSWEGYGKNN